MKKHGFQRMILLIELFTYVKCFRFKTFFSVYELLDEVKKMRKF